MSPRKKIEFDEFGDKVGVDVLARTCMRAVDIIELFFNKIITEKQDQARKDLQGIYINASFGYCLIPDKQTLIKIRHKMEGTA